MVESEVEDGNFGWVFFFRGSWGIRVVVEVFGWKVYGDI